MALAQASLGNVAAAYTIMDEIMAAAIADPDRDSEAQAAMMLGLLLLKTDITTYNGCLYLQR